MARGLMVYQQRSDGRSFASYCPQCGSNLLEEGGVRIDASTVACSCCGFLLQVSNNASTPREDLPSTSNCLPPALIRPLLMFGIYIAAVAALLTGFYLAAESIK